jgi:transposase InsO family protein
MQHANAPLTAHGRLRMVLLVEEEGFTLQAAAAACNVAKSTCWEWVRRWRAASEPERVTLSALKDRSSRPHRSPNQVPAEEAARICERRQHTGWSPRRLAEEPDIARVHSTIHQVLRRGGCSRRPRPQAPAVVRYEWPCPGNLLHMDVKKLGKFTEPGHAVTGDRTRRSRRIGWEYVHSIIDDCSRLAYSEIHQDETAATVTAFTSRALDWFLDQGIVCERLMTDNAFAYTQSKTFKQLLWRRAIIHIRTRPYTPRTNGKVERFHQTLMRECGLRARIRHLRRPRTSPATLDQPLQRAPHPLSARQPATTHPRSGRHRAQHLAHT